MKTLDLQRRLRGSKRDRRGIHIKEERVQRVSLMGKLFLPIQMVEIGSVRTTFILFADVFLKIIFKGNTRSYFKWRVWNGNRNAKFA